MIDTTNEHQWALETSAALKEGRLDEVDLNAVADEIRGIAMSLEREFIFHLSNVMLNHLRFLHIRTSVPEREQWRLDADLELLEVRSMLQDYPTLEEAITQEYINDAYAHARGLFAIDTRHAVAPEACPYSMDWILTHDRIS